MSGFDVFDKTLEYAQRNYYIDIEDKLPIFLCSIGAHVFNALNKCSRCDFDPDSPLVDEENDFIITNFRYIWRNINKFNKRNRCIIIFSIIYILQRVKIF